MKQQKIVFLNEDGLYLNITEVSSHAPHKQYTYSWDLLGDATPFYSIKDIEKLSFKDDRPRSVTYAKVEVLKVIKLIGN